MPEEKKSGKSTVEEIKSRFDNDVERFSNEHTGQTSTVDSQHVLDLVMDTIPLVNPNARAVCDIGCGAGNFSLRLTNIYPGLTFTLIDLSQPMLTRAESRLEQAGGVVKELIQEDIRAVTFKNDSFDIVLASAVLHHLRNRQEWEEVITKIYRSLSEDGSFWFWDLIKHESDNVEEVQRSLYRKYLINLKDEEYQKHVFDYIAKEDSPESIPFILRALENAGFRKVDILHKKSLFAAIMAQK